MTGPTGDKPHGYWDVLEVDPPRSIVMRDGFADENGNPNTEFPAGIQRVDIAAIGGGRTRMTITSEFPDQAAMEQLLAMGQEEGMKQAMGQIDAILAEGSPAPGAAGGGY
jgi:uncharacterized protein YndB with AHSA1/START domain